MKFKFPLMAVVLCSLAGCGIIPDEAFKKGATLLQDKQGKTDPPQSAAQTREKEDLASQIGRAVREAVSDPLNELTSSLADLRNSQKESQQAIIELNKARLRLELEMEGLKEESRESRRVIQNLQSQIVNLEALSIPVILETGKPEPELSFDQGEIQSPPGWCEPTVPQVGRRGIFSRLLRCR